MTFRHLALTSIIGTAVAVSGCESSLPGLGAPDVVGSYDLRSLDGKNLPATISHTHFGVWRGQLDGIVELVSSNLLIRADGNYVVDGVLRVTPTGGPSETISDVVTGTWNVSRNFSGSRIGLTPDAGGCTETGPVLSNRIIIDVGCADGFRYIYEK